MATKRMTFQRLRDGGEHGYQDPVRPDRGWIRVLTELELRLRLVEIAKRRNVTLSSIVREALWAYLGQTVRSENGMIRFHGGKNPDRRRRVERGHPLDDIFPLVLNEFRKQSSTYAVKMPIEFEVETLEGVMRGKKGDYLALGSVGELYPVDADAFEKDHQQA